ncbi:MAG: nucleoside hydrolase [Immundisolibacterales bacterium]|nr:nucleoside hydrolase [Immundisolibacterales bacterium]
MSTNHRRIILDCDPGRDDALAIAMALASSAEIEIAGITTVAGNVPLEVTHRNARFLCELCGFPETPVHAGAARPVVGAPVTATRHHGESGLEGVEVTTPVAPVESHGAVEFMADTLQAGANGEITIVAVGPLTNVALLALEHPGLVAKVREIVVMGGASQAGGNVTPAAEFNVYADPHAAGIVLDCGRPITIHGLDVTHQVLATPAHVERLADAGGEVARRLAPLLRPAQGSRGERFGPDRSPIHDPCTIAWLLRPELFRTEEVPVACETDGTYTHGATVVDWWGVTGEEPNARWVTEADGEAVLDLLIERIARL